MQRFGTLRFRVLTAATAVFTGLAVLAAPVAAAHPAQDPMPMPTPSPAASPAPAAPAPAPAAPGPDPMTMAPEAIPPADHVAGSVVRLQTWARVSVVVHHSSLYKIELEPHADPRLAGSGFFVNPGGVLATASTVVDVDRARLETWGINQAFAKTFGMPLPADPYARTHSPDGETDEHLQGCYDHERAGSECAVFVSTETRAYPYLSPPVDAGLLVTPIAQSGPLAVLSSTASGDVTTAALATAPSPHWTYVGWTETPHGQAPATLSGDFPAADTTVPPEALGRLAQLAGSGLRGSVLVDDRGAILAMLQMVDGRPVTVPAADIATTLHSAGIEVRTGPVDTQMSTGLDYIASHEYANAEPYLDQAAATTGGQAVALKYLDVARQKKNTAEDQSGMAASHTGEPAGSGINWVAVGLSIAGVLLLLALGLLWWRKRRRGDDPPAPQAATAVPGPRPPAARPAAGPAAYGAGPERAPSGPPIPATVAAPPPAHPNGHGVARDEGTTVVHRQPSGSGQPEFCPSCGANLAPGDRFCFSCGTPARRQVGR